MVVYWSTAVIIFGRPTKFLVVLGLPDYHYFDPCTVRGQSGHYLNNEGVSECYGRAVIKMTEGIAGSVT